ncbi:unnamed protein product [Miscanthus lutarioriparius]|uniref:Legume lectin domain-containing protein n=1 Tax=Miscanthus lutarioriparius TaxID=422564 RepID=A0A811N396_9POAL|nr:unnamed protein product [Miscanthus lutarioriparius]
MAGITTITSASTCTAVGLIVFFFLAPVAALSFNYDSFSPEDRKDIRVEGDAYISSGWIEVTANRLSGIGHSTGRASYNARPMRLWDKDTGEVASFTTRFAFVIDPPGDHGIDNKGTGMAFFLAAAYPSSLPSGSYAYNIGLTNQSADAVAAGDARFVAVEFDTFNDTIAHDPNDTYDHVGIDVNSIRSVATQTLPSFTLIGNMSAEIRYHNLSSVLEMTLWLGDGRDTPPSYNISHKVDLKSALPEDVSVGFSASTSTSIELHQLHSWHFSSSLEPKATPILLAPPPAQRPPPPPPPPPPMDVSGSGRAGVIAGASVGAALLLVLLVALAALLQRRRRRKQAQESDDDEPIMEIELGTGPRRFPYHKLVAATKGFAPEEKLGQGGFGSVLLDGQKNAVFRLVEWVWDLYGRGAALAAADERLKGEYDAAEVERVVAVGLWCAHPDPRARPSIRVAMAALQSNHGPVPALPAKMPVATYAVPLASPEGGGLSSYNASSSGMTSSSLTQSSSTTVTSQTSCSSDASAATGFKDSSSLLKHQWC